MGIEALWVMLNVYVPDGYVFEAYAVDARYSLPFVTVPSSTIYIPEGIVCGDFKIFDYLIVRCHSY